MPVKRKDHKGRVLREGESQRKNLLYQYRYTDEDGKRHTVYSSDLKELREKEAVILRDREDGIRYSGGQITVTELVERYIDLKQGVRYNTKVGYKYVLNVTKKEDFGKLKIRDIHVSDAKRWMLKLHDDGKGYSTLTSVRGVIKPAFQMAYEEDMIRRNPFDFTLSDIVSNDAEKRIALTPDQQEIWMSFIREDKTYSTYYDEFVVLLGTGMRVSEFCGLTRKDLDFKRRRIRVDHQLIRQRNGGYRIEKTKTASGCRFIPMSPEVLRSLKNILKNRRKVRTEMIVDSYSDFILIDQREHPKVALHIENEMRWAMKKYCKLHPDKPLPKITPHVFRHTFCTNMAAAGMDAKTLQYLMGHADIGVTLNVYTHATYDLAEQQMAKILNFEPAVTKAKAKNGHGSNRKKLG